MTATYSTAMKNNRMQVVLDAINAGAGAGKLEIGTSGMVTVLATIALADPAGSVGGVGVLTLTVPQSDTSADATGTAAAARIRDSNDADVITGLTVGLSGTEVILDSLSITIGQKVTVTAATFTHA